MNSLLKTTATFTILLFITVFIWGQHNTKQLTPQFYDLHFKQLPTVWDEGIPVGNGIIGGLVWAKDGKLRISFDRTDLWDLRRMENLQTPEWKYKWVREQWEKNDYKPVQDKFDVPYDRSPAPSKIPGAAVEFDISSLGAVESVHLYLDHALCEIVWESGTRFQTFIHAKEAVGWYCFEDLDQSLPYELIPPKYNSGKKNKMEDPVTGQDLRRLGYPKGEIVRGEDYMTYDQQGWGGFSYQVHLTAKTEGQMMEGCWSMSSRFPAWDEKALAKEVVNKHLVTGMDADRQSHTSWWNNFWNKSDIQIPDELLLKQWKLELYKLGSAARKNTPPISLQAVWTADNGKLPPWKGDFHHDLNTQLSYWPTYSGNHLEEETGFINWLWKYRETFEKYTRDYFEVEGLNVPGVTTLTGEPMGGWIQYSFGPTVSAWLAQHFYLHWRYTMDRDFLTEKAYPWVREVAIFLEAISEKSENGMRKLPISSSPEIFNNSRNAWFGHTTNFDLALIRWTFEKAAELARETGNAEEATKWESLLKEWPDFAIDPQTGLMFANGFPYHESHRHFSHQMAYHPLGLIDFSNGEKHRQIIRNTINRLDSIGSQAWVGYSFSWLANLKARAFDGDGAAEALRIFASSFCLPNSFHVNGDQSGKGYSSFTYRPFTLEGNFAFAAGLQEMLIQSHTGVIRLFPAVPAKWTDIGFDGLRAEGAFLISANMDNGLVQKVEIKSEAGGTLRLKNPFDNYNFNCSSKFKMGENDLIMIHTKPGDKIILKK